MLRELWIYCERKGGRILPDSLALLAHAASCWSHAVKIAAVVTEHGDRQTADLLFAMGAARVYGCRHDCRMSERQTALTLCRLSRTHRPSIFLFSATAAGRSIAAQTAAMLGTGLTAGCTGLTLREDGILVQTRPSYEGSRLAEIICPEKEPQMATVMPGLYPVPLPGYDEAGGCLPLRDCGPDGELLPLRGERSGGEFIPFPPAGYSSSIFQLKCTPLLKAKALAQADIVVAGGAGIGSAGQFQRLEQFADRIGAAVGASRGAVNAGYARPECQIGQTGISIRPKLYLAFAVSGAIQHLAGVGGASCIIAVNRDPGAPILSCADLALVCDWQEGLEAIAARYESIKQK